MMLGGLGISEAASSAASKAFVANFESNKSLFRQCYARGLNRNASLQGSLDVRVVLSRDGSIYELTPTHVGLDDNEVVQCMVDVFRRLRYQPLQDGEYFSVTAPLKLKPQ